MSTAAACKAGSTGAVGQRDHCCANRSGSGFLQDCCPYRALAVWPQE